MSKQQPEVGVWFVPLPSGMVERTEAEIKADNREMVYAILDQASRDAAAEKVEEYRRERKRKEEERARQREIRKARARTKPTRVPKRVEELWRSGSTASWHAPCPASHMLNDPCGSGREFLRLSLLERQRRIRELMSEGITEDQDLAKKLGVTKYTIRITMGLERGGQPEMMGFPDTGWPLGRRWPTSTADKNRHEAWTHRRALLRLRYDWIWPHNRCERCATEGPGMRHCQSCGVKVCPSCYDALDNEPICVDCLEDEL